MKEKTLFDFIKKKGKHLIVPVCMIIFGILLVVNPVATLASITKILGWILLLVGIITAVAQMAFFSPVTVTMAILFFVVGLIAVVNPVGLSAILIKIFGILVLLSAGVRIYDAVQVKSSDKPFWTPFMISDVVTAVVGLVLVIFSFSVFRTLGLIIGIVMLILGVMDILNAYRTYKFGGFLKHDSDAVWEE